MPVSRFIWCFLSVLLATLVAVKADADSGYSISISVYSYSNPTGKCLTCATSPSGRRSCCDDDNNFGTCFGNDQCDPAFLFCLMPLGGSSLGDCADHTITVSPRLELNAPSVTPSSGKILGLDIPFQLEGISSNWTGVQVYIGVLDADNILPNGTDPLISDDDVIDEFTIRIFSSTPIGRSISRATYNGNFGFATMSIGFRVDCPMHYYGEDCQNLNECSFNSVSCGRNRQCVDGEGTFTCVCASGFSGEDCDQREGETSDPKSGNTTLVGGAVGALIVVAILVALVVAGIWLYSKHLKPALMAKKTVNTRTSAVANPPPSSSGGGQVVFTSKCSNLQQQQYPAAPQHAVQVEAIQVTRVVAVVKSKK